MTAPDIAAIEARLTAATPGPWVLDYEACDCGDGYGCSHGRWPYQIRNAHHQQMTGSPEVEAANVCGGWPGCAIEHRHAASELAEMTEADAELIVHAPTDLTEVLAYVRRLEADRDRARPLLDALTVWRYAEGEIDGVPTSRGAENALAEAFDTWTST